jgi:hypothetical protein
MVHPLDSRSDADVKEKSTRERFVFEGSIVASTLNTVDRGEFPPNITSLESVRFFASIV